MYDRATLEIGPGTFEMAGNLTVTPSIRTGYLVEGQGSTIWSWASEATGGDDKRAGVYLEAGGGAHIVEIEFDGWKGSQDSAGNPLQWGDTGNGGTELDATGERALAQIQCLTEYLNRYNISSLNRATLSFGERSPSGKYDPLKVAIEGPTMTKTSEDGEVFSGTLTCVRARDAEAVGDLSERVPW